LDLGNDEFTVGRAHPMIDPSLRTEIIANGIGEEVAVLLFDLVLGYGSHQDPVSEMLDALVTATKKAQEKGRYLAMICSICGTISDPQDYRLSKKRLEDIGVIVADSNAQAAYLAKEILTSICCEPVKINDLFSEDLSVINVGLSAFYQDLKRSQTKVVNVDWRPLAGGDKKMTNLLNRLK
jgi:FdrA protein